MLLDDLDTLSNMLSNMVVVMMML